VGRRIERLGSLLQREISTIVTHELSDPHVGFVTITGVTLSDDMQHATVDVSVMGDKAAQERSVHALRRARGHIQGLVGERLKLRWTPILSFRVDEGVKRSIRISGILHKIAEERRAHEQDREGAGEENIAPAADRDAD